ncbi:MAG: hypothetical protein ABEK50_02805, partial [bacterium]
MSIDDQSVDLLPDKSVETGWEDGDCPEELSEELFRDTPADIPNVPEPQVVRHFNRLSRDSFGVDTGPYLLGSCTMKYNPRLNERIAGLDHVVEAVLLHHRHDGADGEHVQV